MRVLLLLLVAAVPGSTDNPAEDLRRLAAARRALEVAQAEVREGVEAARRAGRSWAEVGEALGVTRQAAFKRFGSPRDPRTGAPMTPTTVTDVVELTERAFRLLDAGDTDALRALMSPEAAEVLTADLLVSTWAAAVAETGRLEGTTGTSAHLPEPDGTPLADGERVLGLVVGRTLLECEAGEWAGRVAVGPDGQVVGMLVVPPGTTGLAF